MALVDPLQAADHVAEGYVKFGPLVWTLSLALVALAVVSILLLRSKNSQIEDLRAQLLIATEALGAVQDKRIVDRDAFQTRLDSLARETNATMGEVAKSNFALTRAVEGLQGRRSGKPPHGREGNG